MSYPDLKERIKAIQKVLDRATLAKRLPEQRYQEAMRITPKGYTTEAQMEVFVDVLQKHAAEERRQGEIAMHRELRRLAVELDRLRADLPELAAAARFELLDSALEWRA